MMRKLLAVAIILQCSVAYADDIEVSVHDPRPFGYFLGDVLVRTFKIVTHGDITFRASALPQPGPKQYWLDLVDVKHEAKKSASETAHSVALTYQIFYSALEPKRVVIPKTTLVFEAGDKASSSGADAQSLTRTIPELEVIVSPLREIIPEKAADPNVSPLRADTTAAMSGTGTIRTGLLGSFALLLASLVALAHHYAFWPFGQRTQRPFTRADRELRGQSLGHTTDSYENDLRILHRAFDETFGRRVFTQDVPDFLQAHAEFQALEPRVREFFDASRLVFFSAQAERARATFPAGDVGALARDLARQERKAA